MGTAASLTELADELAEIVDLHLALSAEALADLAEQGVSTRLLTSVGRNLHELGEQAQRVLIPLTAAARDAAMRTGLRLWPAEEEPGPGSHRHTHRIV